MDPLINAANQQACMVYTILLCRALDDTNQRLSVKH